MHGNSGKGVDKVETGAREAKKSGIAFKNVVDRINKTVNLINRITPASGRQSATTGEVAKNIQRIFSEVREVAEKTENNIRPSSQVTHLSTELQREVGRFRI
jgi:methyl-accepting chemotaxis protein